jgi:WD40 repeat protein
MSKPELIVPVGHTNAVTSVAFSPDGRYILTGSVDQTAKLWDMEGRELATFTEHLNAVNAVSFSPDGRRFLTASMDPVAKVWDAHSGEVALTLEGHERAVFTGSFSADGKRILTGGRDQTAKVWDAATGKLLFSLEDHSAAVRSSAFSPDGKYILTGCDDGQIKLWSVRQKKARLTFDGNKKPVYSVTFSPDGKQMLTGSADKTAQVRDVRTGKLIRTLEGHADAVRAVAWSRDGDRILTASEDSTAIVWNASTGKKIRTLKGHEAAVRGAAISPDGKRFLTGSRDNTVRCWEAAPGASPLILRGHGNPITSAAFSSDERYILLGIEDHTAMVWDTAAAKTSLILKGHTAKVNDVAFSPDDLRILTGSEDAEAKIWDAQSGEALLPLKGHAKAVNAVAFSRNGRRVATGSSDNTAKIWDAASGKLLTSLTGHSKTVFAVAFSPDGKLLLTGSSDNTGKIWDVETGRSLITLEGHKEPVRSAAYSPQGDKVITGSGDKTARIWDAATGKTLFVLQDHKFDLRAVAFSPDGRRALTSAYDETAKMWDVDTGELLFTLEGHNSTPRALAFSPDGRRVLTGSRDNMIKFWDSGQGEEIATLVPLGSTDWVATVPSGLFDATPDAMQLMHYVVNYKGDAGSEWILIELDQLKERYYEPGLLPKILGRRQGEIRDVSEFEHVNLFPRIDTAVKKDALRIHLKPRNGGIGKVSLFINDKEVAEDVDPGRSADITVDLIDYGKYFLLDAPSKVSVRAYNEEGWLKSRAHAIEYLPDFVASKDLHPFEPEEGVVAEPAILQSLYAIVVGTSKYLADGIRDLSFPDKDAEDMANALQLAGKNLFEDRVHIHLLTTSAKTPGTMAVKANIRAAFEKTAAEAGAHDVLVVYFSGHGANHGAGEQAQFYYLTRDLASDNLHDPAIRKAGTISSQELTQWISEIAAGKQVLILDTCHSGKIVETLSGGRAADDSARIRALDRMKDRTGMFVLAGSAADRVSYETSLFGQGLLTYSLLFGMKGPALKENQIDVSSLFQYARDAAPELAKAIRQQQEPVVAVPRGGDSFSLGIVDQIAREKIRIATPKKVVISSVFQDKNTFDDPLQLSENLDNYFRNLNALGKDAPFLFVEIRELDIAYYVRGLYSRQNDVIEVEGRVFKHKKEIGAFRLSGKRGELEEKIVEKVKGLMW